MHALSGSTRQRVEKEDNDNSMQPSILLVLWYKINELKCVRFGVGGGFVLEDK